MVEVIALPWRSVTEVVSEEKRLRSLGQPYPGWNGADHPGE